jgi:predicted ATPase
VLTRLKVRGFKNLVDVDVRFGPFTCIAGANGVGKSNLFDAIAFLSALADKPLLEAALSVRDETGRGGDIRSLFHRVGEEYADSMSFEVEMIIPLEGTDDLGQQATATITFLEYRLTLGYRRDNGSRSLGGLEVVEEHLSRIRLGDAPDHLRFSHAAADWRRSAVRGKERTKLAGHRTAPFISTAGAGPERVVKIHQDGGSRGRAKSLLASTLPRTVLSTVNATESPTVTLARNEMRSWRLLQLEPASLRKSDPYVAPVRLASDGSHLAATLYHLATSPLEAAVEGGADEGVYSRIASRLTDLIDDVRSVSVDRDDRRELLTVYVTGRDGTAHPARALSDGTLRFLALAVLEMDPEATGLFCLEEPENGIHPERIPAMLQLLEDIATDVHSPLGPDNALRQVIINTHSPAVVAQVDEEDVLVAEVKETVGKNGLRFDRLVLSCLDGTWRARPGDSPIAAPAAFLPYLNPARLHFGAHPSGRRSGTKKRRVADRDDLQAALPFGA